MPERLYGIRHHGPGSARAVVQELERQPPDVLLVEGPPEADALVRWVADSGLEPPVALLGYASDDPRRAAFWPFAVFSPEWQAIRWAVERGVPVRFFDLPFAYRLADERADGAAPGGPDFPAPGGPQDAAPGEDHTAASGNPPAPVPGGPPARAPGDPGVSVAPIGPSARPRTDAGGDSAGPGSGGDNAGADAGRNSAGPDTDGD
ncbi:MAG: DUF5682 family protein, partial [Actinomycetota bacterium]|nr:DUF5682 family protein [Actinomycetota bacterium]